MRRANQDQMEAVVASYQSSGLTQREYCLQQHIKLPTFSYWYRKVCEKPVASPSGFTEASAPVHAAGLEVVFPNGTIVRGIHDLAVIQQLIKW